jgi:hypothetical protein
VVCRRGGCARRFGASDRVGERSVSGSLSSTRLFKYSAASQTVMWRRFSLRKSAFFSRDEIVTLVGVVQAVEFPNGWTRVCGVISEFLLLLVGVGGF